MVKTKQLGRISTERDKKRRNTGTQLVKKREEKRAEI